MGLDKAERAIIACALISSLFLLPSAARAHGGHDESKTPQSEPTAPEPEKNIHVGENRADPDASPPPSRMDPLPNKPHDAHSPAGRDEPRKIPPQVKMSAHEWVSPSRKGYTIAVGITVLAGLVFGILSWKRPNE